MTKIKLKKIALHNFKAVHDKEIDLGGKNAIISGRNGSGKTTIYEAYYWCLFGKTLTSNGIVQTLDGNNEIVHKVDTSVELVLNVDDDYDVVIRRTLVEKRKARDTADEKMMGTETQRYWNDVPVSMSEYKKKLGELVPIEQWQLLSNAQTFMSYKMDDRRKVLLSVAGEVDERALMQPFPALLKAVAEHKTIDELQKQTKNTFATSNKELNEIPAQIKAQDALKVTTSEEGDKVSAEKVQEYFDKEKQLKDGVEKANKDWWSKQRKNLVNLHKKVEQCEETLRKAKNAEREHNDENERRVKKLTEVTFQFEEKKNEWQKVNSETFDFKQSDVCPVCGAPLSEDFKINELDKAIAEFNDHKSKELGRLMQEAQELSTQKNVLSGAIKSYKTTTKPSDDKAVNDAGNALNAASKEREDAMKLTVEDCKEYKDAKKALEEHQATKPENADDVVQLKANIEINRRVDGEKKRLQKRSLELSQIIADCRSTLSQIFDYKKSKIDAVESKVNGLFDIVRWKFYQQNMTNDDLQEIYTCLVGGVDYVNLNTASKVNANVDIINGISKAANIYVPLFIDGKESVTEILTSIQQQIMLKVVSNEDLTVKVID